MKIHWYGVIIMIAFILGFSLVCIRIDKNKNSFEIKKDDIYDFSIGMLVVGILSARLYYVLFNLKYYLENPIEIFQIWNGGLAIYGGIIGVILYAFIFCKIKKIKFLNLADLVIPYLALAQSIGRWGNFVNQEAYGAETNLPWKMGLFDKTIVEYIYVHPTFIYESIFTFLLFWILLMLSKRRKYKGQIFYVYMIGYGFIRFFVEGLRSDSLMLGDIRISQFFSIIFVTFFGILYICDELCRTKKNKGV